MRINTPKHLPPEVTHEGGHAARQTPEIELRRAVSTCLLWENTFYERGSDIAARMTELCKRVKPEFIASLAQEARNDLKLRHVPLFLALQMVHLHHQTAKIVIDSVIHRPDEMGELLSMYWKDGKKPIAAQLKKGLAKAFTKFSEYQLSKWDREATIKLRDVMFLTHPRPKDRAQAETWKKLVDNKLESADTWEVALSVPGADKLQVWARLLKEGLLGDIALLMNLRNMLNAGVDVELIDQAIRAKAGKSKALPFRYVSALRYAPQLLNALDYAMKASITGKLAGSTALVIDVSGSMDAPISGKSQMSRLEAAAALGILLAAICDRFRLFTFSERVVEVPALASLALVSNIYNSQGHSSTYLKRALEQVSKQTKVDRAIVITDEQSSDGILPAWTDKAYLISVASYKPALDTNQGWTRVSGWSERVIDWIRLEEGLENNSTSTNSED